MKQQPPPKSELAALAREAQTAAPKQSDPRNQVSCLRTATVAAWQSGDEALVLPISSEAIAGCDELPNRDASSPADCTVIRCAAPMAVQDKIAEQLQAFSAKRQASPAKTLPAADAAPLQQDFDDLERNFGQLSAVRTGLNGLAAPADVAGRVDRYRLIVLCNAILTTSLYGAADGASVDTFKNMGERKKRMGEGMGLTQAEVAEKCRSQPPIPAPEP